MTSLRCVADEVDIHAMNSRYRELTRSRRGVEDIQDFFIHTLS